MYGSDEDASRNFLKECEILAISASDC